ncbi:MAG: hypothetical protein WC659_07050 [Patescibacteria group bacterium]
MLKKKIINTLNIICRTLKGKKIKWVLIGSTSLALQGVRITPEDIDILTDKKGALAIGKLFKKYEIAPVVFGRTELFESYFGKFDINRTNVEVMGNLREKLDNQWTSLSKRLASPKLIEINKMKIPVSPLITQLNAYEKLGRKKDALRVKKIRHALKVAHTNTLSAA